MITEESIVPSKKEEKKKVIGCCLIETLTTSNKVTCMDFEG
jgi:hypothetical protein